MVDEKKFLDQNGIEYLWSQLSLEDYPNNETLIAVLNAIDTTKADKNEIPTLTSELTNDSNFIDSTTLNDYYNKTEVDAFHGTLEDYVDNQVAALVNAAPETLDTLGELAEAFQEHEEVVDVLNEAIATKYSSSNPPPYPVTSVNGKTGAVSLSIPTVPTKVSAFTNDAGYITQADVPVRGIDYWTEADKADMVNDVLAALPTWNGGSY